jgi:hypothetical protein
VREHGHRTAILVPPSGVIAELWLRRRSTVVDVKHVPITAAGIALLAVIAANVAAGASATAQPSRVAIHEQNKPVGMEHHGQFRLVLNDITVDSGKTSITLIGSSVGQAKMVGGQPQELVAGNDNLTGKNGTLSIAFRGISIPVNLNPNTGKAYYTEFGTWKVAHGTGMYKGWKGSGRWADSGSPTIDNVEWDGYITH